MKDPRGVLNAHDAAANMGSVYMIDAFTALLANQREKRSQVYLLVDSGADHHVIRDFTLFREIDVNKRLTFNTANGRVETGGNGHGWFNNQECA